MQVLLGLVVGRLAARDGQQAFLGLDRQFFRLEAGDGDLDAVGILVGALDVVGRIAGGGFGLGGGVELRGQAVEADERAVQGRKVDRTHKCRTFFSSKVAVSVRTFDDPSSASSAIRKARLSSAFG